MSRAIDAQTHMLNRTAAELPRAHGRPRYELRQRALTPPEGILPRLARPFSYDTPARGTSTYSGIETSRPDGAESGGIADLAIIPADAP